jgi:hypothetical protein
MRKRLVIQKLIVFVVLIAMLLAPMLALAQEDTAPTTEEAATVPETSTTGLTILILLVGLGALALVAGRFWLRDVYEGETTTSGEG